MLLISAIAVAMLLAGGVALAKNIKCPNRDNNLCVGTNQNDTMTGTRSSDTIKARGGYDTVMAGRGRDKVFGGGGLDILNGGRGNDVLEGGDGSDVHYHFAQAWGKDRIIDTPTPTDNNLDNGHLVDFRLVTDDLTINMNSGTGPEVKNVSGTNAVNWDNDLIDAVLDGQGDDTIIGRDVGDTIQPVIGGIDIVGAGGGDDYVNARDNVNGDMIDCGAGTNDVVVKDAGDTAINCES
jgi:Ca2+-binding RTX toxin-like protein